MVDRPPAGLPISFDSGDGRCSDTEQCLYSEQIERLSDNCQGCEMPARTAPTARSSEGMGGLAKGLAIIEALATHGVLSVSDAARSSNISRAAARRCLITLTELGYVEQSGREFRPTARLRRLGGANTPRDRIPRLGV